MQVNECNSFIVGRCEIDRESEYKDRADEEQGQPVQEPGHRVEIEQFGIAIGPKHPNTLFSCPCKAARRGDRITRAFIPGAPHARAEFG